LPIFYQTGGRTGAAGPGIADRGAWDRRAAGPGLWLWGKPNSPTYERKRLKARTRKKFKITTKSDHNLPIVEDLVGREFSTSLMNELWLSDITYIWTWAGWMYPAIVMDVYNR
jgi:transposase InsO family protein